MNEPTTVGRPVEHPLPPLTPAADFEDMPPWWQWAEAQLALDDTAASSMEWK